MLPVQRQEAPEPAVEPSLLTPRRAAQLPHGAGGRVTWQPRSESMQRSDMAVGAAVTESPDSPAGLGPAPDSPADWSRSAADVATASSCGASARNHWRGVRAKGTAAQRGSSGGAAAWRGQ